MIFRDRIEAGEKLASELFKYKNKEDTVIIGLPRGGVPVAYEVAERLNLPMDIVCPRKIGAPMNKEFAIGAITETGEGIFDTNTIARLHIPKEYIDEEVKAEKVEAQHRLEAYREGRPPRNLKDKTVLIIDDGLATGSTMKAAIKSIKAEGAKKIVVAVPVSPPDTVAEVRDIVDEVVCLDAPIFFQAVGQFYEDFRPTEDEEVVELMKISRQG
ncbi:MAG: putative phosphoribosyl transferase [Chlamydiae bacterium]|nr:putative phosphoribosyl transferase [Chlamydiota bacterium]